MGKLVRKKMIGTKWVPRVKTYSKGNLDKYKAKVMALGFRQTEGVNNDGTFAPTIKFESWRAVVAMSTSMRLELDQMNVVLYATES